MESPRRAAHAWPRPTTPPVLLVLVVLVVLLPLLAAGAGERLSSREVLARARERMEGAELGSLLTKTTTTTTRKGPAKAAAAAAATTRTSTSAVQHRDGGAAEATKEEEAAVVAPEVDMNANTAKVMFETIRRMNPGLAPLREQLPGQPPHQPPPPQQAAHNQHKNPPGSKVKAALGGKAVTRRVSKKPLPALARHASSSSYVRLRELLGDNEPQQQQQPPQQVAPTTLVVSDLGVAAEQTAPGAGRYSGELQQVQAAEVRENSALHALLQDIELHYEDNSEEEEEEEEEEEPREPSGEDEEAIDGRGDAAAAAADEPKGIRNEELTSSAGPSAPRSAAERAEEAALLERLMEAYAAYAALRQEPPPFAFDAAMGLGHQMPADHQRAQAAAVERDPAGGDAPTHHHATSLGHLALVPAAAELSPEPLLT